MAETKLEEALSEVLAKFCTGDDAHDPPPCGTCAEMRAEILVIAKQELAAARERVLEEAAQLADSCDKRVIGDAIRLLASSAANSPEPRT